MLCSFTRFFRSVTGLLVHTCLPNNGMHGTFIRMFFGDLSLVYGSYFDKRDV